MNRESNEPASEPLRWPAKASGVGAAAFILVLGFMWAYHPILLERHPGRVLAQCGLAALIAFIATWFVDAQKKPGS